MNADTSPSPNAALAPDRPARLPARLWGRLRAATQDPGNQTLLAILFLAGILRLGHLDLIEFKLDEARHLRSGLAIVQSLRLPLVGSESSLGLHKPPLMSYLLALPTLLGRDPRYASAFIALLNVAGVAGLYLLARRYYGQRTATLAALLLAVNPWAIVFSRKAFTADVLLPFGLLTLWGLHLAIVDRSPWGWVVSIASLALMLNITFSPALLLPVLLILLVLYPRRATFAHLLLGLCLAGLISAPYLYCLNLSRLAGPRELLARLQEGGALGGSGTPAAEILRMATWFHSGHNLISLSGVSASEFAPAQVELSILDRVAQLFFVLGLAALPSLAVRAWSHWKDRRDPASYVILLAWLWIPLGALLAAEPGWFEPHYLVVLYPASFLSMGLLLNWLLSRFDGLLFGRWLLAVPFRLLTWLIILGLVGWQAYSAVYLFRFVGDHDTSGGYGVPYRFWKRTAEAARHQAHEARTSQVWVVAQGTDPGYEEQPAILDYLLGPSVDAVFLGRGGNEAILLPAARAGVYLFTRPAAVVEGTVHQLGGTLESLVLSSQGDLEARLYVTPAHSVDEMLSLIEQEGLWSLDSGVRLLGYAWPEDARAGEVARMATYWTFVDVPAAERSEQHSLFVHVLDPDGEKVAQRDGYGLPETYWDGGLLLKQWFDIYLPEELPAGEYTLRVGMYRLSDFAHSHFLDETGADLGETITLGPVLIGP